MKEEQPVNRVQSDSNNQAQPAAGKAGRRRFRRIIVALIVLAAIVTGAILGWRAYVAKRVPENIIALSGRIEGDDSSIAPKTSGRILEIRFREGDYVHAGETIAILDDAQVRAREDQARAGLVTAEASAQAAREQIGILEQQLKQNQLQTEQAKVDAEGRVLRDYAKRASGAGTSLSFAERCRLYVGATRTTELDDIDIASCTTVGSVVVPVAVAVATRQRADARTLLAAVVAGYEAMQRLGRAIGGATLVYRGVWPTYVTAPFAAAATAARLLGLDAHTTACALALALTRTSAAPAAALSRFGSSSVS